MSNKHILPECRKECENLTLNSVSQAIDNISQVISAYKIDVASVLNIAERSQRSKIAEAEVFRTDMNEKLYAALLIFGSLLGISKAFNTEGIVSGLLFGQLLAAPWFIVVSIFLLIDPRHVRTLRSIGNAWFSLLITIMSVLIPLYIDGSGGIDYMRWIKVCLYALLWMIPVYGAMFWIYTKHRKRQRLIAQLQSELQILIDASQFIHASSMQILGSEKPTVPGKSFLKVLTFVGYFVGLIVGKRSNVDLQHYRLKKGQKNLH